MHTQMPFLLQKNAARFVEDIFDEECTYGGQVGRTHSD